MNAKPELRPTIEQFTDTLRPVVAQLCDSDDCGVPAAFDDPESLLDEEIDITKIGANLKI